MENQPRPFAADAGHLQDSDVQVREAKEIESGRAEDDRWVIIGLKDDERREDDLHRTNEEIENGGRFTRDHSQQHQPVDKENSPDIQQTNTAHDSSIRQLLNDYRSLSIYSLRGKAPREEDPREPRLLNEGVLPE